jgi:pyridoxal phosphate enzyme (YggS family)
MSVAERLRAVRERIAAAAAAAGRSPGEVRLLAVSKTQPSSAVREAYAAGQRDFGENYVQELLEKAEALRDLPELRWHVIGHLQRNKARQVVREASAIHSLDSLELLRELDKRAGAVVEARRSSGQESRIAALIEVNIGQEPQKGGVSSAELGALIDATREARHLALVGLMCVPPADRDPAPFFQSLRVLRDAHGGAKLLPELSMGMSSDLEAAILAGATWVRVGTAIFGERPKKEA